MRTRTTALNGQYVYVDTDYDTQGRAYRTSRPYFSGVPYWIITLFDDLNRPKLVRQADGNDIRTVYNGLTETVYARRTSRDGQGTKELETVKVKGALGNVLEVTDHDNQPVTYAYDVTSNLTRSTDAANNVTTVGYDIRGFKTSMNDPDMGSWTYNYNALGELVSQTNANSQTRYPQTVKLQLGMSCRIRPFRMGK